MRYEIREITIRNITAKLFIKVPLFLFIIIPHSLYSLETQISKTEAAKLQLIETNRVLMSKLNDLQNSEPSIEEMNVALIIICIILMFLIIGFFLYNKLEQQTKDSKKEKQEWQNEINSTNNTIDNNNREIQTINTQLINLNNYQNDRPTAVQSQ